MIFSKKKQYARWSIILSSVVILSLFIWNLSLFFSQLKKEERKKMEIWARAYTEIVKSDTPENTFNPILLSIIEKNTSTPMVLYSTKDSVYSAKNIQEKKTLSQKEMKFLADKFELEYHPIKIYDHQQLYGIIYYGNSSFITKTKYFPALTLLVVVVFLIIIYYFYTISKSNEQNKLWAGMAKETAHQIGTPLSSLVGWIELLKLENVDPSYLTEMEKDIDRLNTITERFSKIGSTPTLQEADLVESASATFDYLKLRSSKLISFSITKTDQRIRVNLNHQLLSWTIENLVKNASDAMRGKGAIHLDITADEKWAYLRLSDTGKGISKRHYKTIFKPGETSKKRGWGLGLSLAKRIVEEYHDGKIKVLKSELGKGSVFEIRLRKIR